MQRIFIVLALVALVTLIAGMWQNSQVSIEKRSSASST
jgi:hypothetical protein